MRTLLLLLAVVTLCGAGYAAFIFKQQLTETPAQDPSIQSSTAPDNEWIPAEEMIHLVSRSIVQRRNIMQRVSENWKPGYATYVVEAFRMAGLSNRRMGEELVSLAEQGTGERIGFNLQAWLQLIWEQDTDLPKDYALFKKLLYAETDEKFGEYFSIDAAHEIELDEIVWGGVEQDGIPPLRNPTHITADKADYLDDGDKVFGVEINGDARCYPNRILAHHEMFTDVIGDVSVCGVY